MEVNGWPYAGQAPLDEELAGINASTDTVAGFLASDAAQNACLMEAVAAKVRSGADCDEWSNGTGGFGRSKDNPVPVNGQVGELLYLSSLRCDATNSLVLFHRLGSAQSVVYVDLFETVSLDGQVWDLLWLDLYHPRKSRRAPSGYRIESDDLAFRSMVKGTTLRVEDFPADLADGRLVSTVQRFLGIPAVDAGYPYSRGGVVNLLQDLAGSLEQVLSGRPGSWNPPAQHRLERERAIELLANQAALEKGAQPRVVIDGQVRHAPPPVRRA